MCRDIDIVAVVLSPLCGQSSNDDPVRRLVAIEEWKQRTLERYRAEEEVSSMNCTLMV